MRIMMLTILAALTAFCIIPAFHESLAFDWTCTLILFTYMSATGNNPWSVPYRPAQVTTGWLTADLLFLNQAVIGYRISSTASLSRWPSICVWHRSLFWNLTWTSNQMTCYFRLQSFRFWKRYLSGPDLPLPIDGLGAYMCYIRRFTLLWYFFFQFAC